MARFPFDTQRRVIYDLDEASNAMIYIVDEIFEGEYNDVEDYYRGVYLDETNACEWYSDDKFDERGEKDRNLIVPYELCFIMTIGKTLAKEYAKKLFEIETALNRSRANYHIGFAKIMRYLLGDLVSFFNYVNGVVEDGD